METAIYSRSGQVTDRKVVLDDQVFCPEPNDHAIYLDVKLHLANRRQGTAKAKERSEMSGSTRKLFRQKGTGGARRGDINSPLLYGGARVFGPKPRDYSFKLNKKLRQLARRSALSYKIQGNQLFVIEDFSMDKPKTKEFVNLLNGFQLAGRKVILVTGDKETNLVLSGRNIPNARVMLAQDLNTYDMMNAHFLLIQHSAVAKIQETLS